MHSATYSKFAFKISPPVSSTRKLHLQTYGQVFCFLLASECNSWALLESLFYARKENMQRKVHMFLKRLDKWRGNMGAAGGECGKFLCVTFIVNRIFMLMVLRERNNLLTRKNKVSCCNPKKSKVWNGRKHWTWQVVLAREHWMETRNKPVKAAAHKSKTHSRILQKSEPRTRQPNRVLK